MPYLRAKMQVYSTCTSRTPPFRCVRDYSGSKSRFISSPESIMLVRSLTVGIVMEILTLIAPTAAVPANLDTRFLLGFNLRLFQDLFHDT